MAKSYSRRLRAVNNRALRGALDKACNQLLKFIEKSDRDLYQHQRLSPNQKWQLERIAESIRPLIDCR
jgi:hypothetical protein